MSRSGTLPTRPGTEVLEGLPPEVREYLFALESLVRNQLNLSEQLTRKLGAAERASKRQATPFRREKRKANRKKPGRKGGHKQERRPLPDKVDREYEGHHADECPCCGEDVETIDFYEQYQQDVIPKIVTRKFTVYIGKCTGCNRQFEGRHPWQTSTARGSANVQIGPTALALAAQLHYGEGVPFDKVGEHLAHLGLEVSTAALVRAMGRIADRAQLTFKSLLEEVLSQPVLHIDETGWSVAGEPCWLWVLSGPRATIYLVRRTRSANEVEDFLQDFAGVLVTDGAKAYDKLGRTLLRALCLLHLKRNVRGLENEQTGGAVHFPRALINWLDRVIDLVGEREQLSTHDYDRRARELEFEFRWELTMREPTNSANRRLLERIRTWEDAIVRCLTHPEVPATNNHAERQIRPAVITRKRGGCNRSERGARTFEVVTSLLVTARQCGLSFVDWVVDLLRQPTPYAPAPFW